MPAEPGSRVIALAVGAVVIADLAAVSYRSLGRLAAAGPAVMRLLARTGASQVLALYVSCPAFSGQGIYG